MIEDLGPIPHLQSEGDRCRSCNRHKLRAIHTGALRLGGPQHHTLTCQVCDSKPFIRTTIITLGLQPHPRAPQHPDGY